LERYRYAISTLGRHCGIGSGTGIGYCARQSGFTGMNAKVVVVADGDETDSMVDRTTTDGMMERQPASGTS